MALLLGGPRESGSIHKKVASKTYLEKALAWTSRRRHLDKLNSLLPASDSQSTGLRPYISRDAVLKSQRYNHGGQTID